MTAIRESDARTSIVTGAAGGIGASLVRQLAGRGDNVLLVDLDETALQRVATEHELDMTRCALVAADVTVEADVERYVDRAMGLFGGIDYVAHNAGVESPVASIEDMAVEDYERIMRVNVRSVFLGLQKILPVMRRQGAGAIVNTASVAGVVGAAGMAPYVASKHAVVGLTRAAAAEVATVGIRVNAVLPGPVDTGMMRRIGAARGTPEQSRRTVEGATPMGRYAHPDEVANVMAFLLSEGASYITASAYPVDGGRTQR